MKKMEMKKLQVFFGNMTKLSVRRGQSSASLTKVVFRNAWAIFLNQNIYVVGTQKNRLNEMVLLSTQNIY